MYISKSARIGMLVAAAVTGAVAMAPLAAQAADGGEKCYGISKAGKNDCATATSSCAGTSKVDRDPSAFLVVPSGTCDKIAGGSTTPGAAMMKSDPGMTKPDAMKK